MNMNSNTFEQYLNYYRDLDISNVENLRDITTKTLHFVDPFNDVEDVAVSYTHLTLPTICSV